MLVGDGSLICLQLPLWLQHQSPGLDVAPGNIGKWRGGGLQLGLGSLQWAGRVPIPWGPEHEPGEVPGE